MDMGITANTVLALILTCCLNDRLVRVSSAYAYSYNAVNSITACGDVNSKFMSYHNVTLEACITECGRRPKCKAINYRQFYNHFCELLDALDVVAGGVVGCMYLKRTDMQLTGNLVNACGCNNGESCDLATNTCSKTECCPIRTVTNGRISGNRYGIGRPLVYRCNNGFEPGTDGTQLTCLASGEWDKMPVCIQMCDPPIDLTDGVISGTEYSQGSILNISCNENFRELNGKTSMACTNNAVWDVTPQCVLKECNAPPSLTGGHISGSTYTIGSALTISCNTGYEEAFGVTLMMCLTSLQWDYTPNCILSDCDHFAQTCKSQKSSYTECPSCHGPIKTVRLTVQESTSECKEGVSWGYDENNIWVDSGCRAQFEFCVKECHAPVSIDNGWVESAATYPVNSQLAITCDPGYVEAMGREHIQCQSDETWDFTPDCVLVDCGQPADPSHGLVDAYTTTYGGVAEIFCDPGYETPDGRTTISCQANGDWEPAPSCVPIVATTQASVCGTGWFLYGTTCFYISTESESNKNFGTAISVCNGFGGSLARLDTQGKYEAVRAELAALTNPGANYWIGLRKTSDDGDLNWVDNGSALTFQNFAIGEPGTNSEWCTFLWKNDGWNWHNGMCDYGCGFVCTRGYYG